MNVQKTSTTRWTAIVTAFALVSAVLGFGREAYIGHMYGVTGLTDAFYVAAIVPDMVAQVIGYALTNAFIPVLRAELRHSEYSASELIGVVFWDSAIILMILAVCTYLFKEQLLYILAPGFSATEHELGVAFLSIMFGAIVFCGLSGVLAGVHNAYGNFFYPSFTGAVHNILLLLIAVVLGHFIGIYGLAYGFLGGFFGRMIIQFIPLVYAGKLKFPRKLWHTAIPVIFMSMGPLFVCGGLETLNLIVDRMLASQLPFGQVSILNFASRLGMIPYSLIGISMATTLYTRFVTHTLEQDKEELYRIVSEGASWMVFIGMVIGTGFVLYGGSILSLLFGHGEFTPEDVEAASEPLKMYGLFTVVYLLQPVFSRFFFARHENWYVVRASLFALFVNIAGSLMMVHSLGIVGLVLANALSQSVLVVSMAVTLVHRLERSVWPFFTRIAYAGFPPGLAFLLGGFIVFFLWKSPAIGETWYELSRGLLAVVVGSAVLLLYAYLFKENMVSVFIRQVVSSLFPSDKQVERTRKGG